MLWSEVRARHPGEWLVIEAVEAHTDEHRRRVFDKLAVLESCPDGAAALRRYRALASQLTGRELYFVHTSCAQLDVEERTWTGIRGNDAAVTSR